jgi:hypothetical protein
LARNVPFAVYHDHVCAVITVERALGLQFGCRHVLLDPGVISHCRERPIMNVKSRSSAANLMNLLKIRLNERNICQKGHKMYDFIYMTFSIGQNYKKW